MKTSLEAMPAFGFDTYTRSRAMWLEGLTNEGRVLEKEQFKNHVNGYMTWGINRNISKGLAYIPVVNLIIAIVSIVFLAKGTYFAGKLTTEGRKTHLPAHIGRIICDICFGPLLAIVDLIKTLVDQHKAKKYLAEAAAAA